MNNKILIAIAIFVVGLGLFAIFHKPAGESIVGGYNTNVDHLANGFYAGQTDQMTVDSAGNATTTGNVTTTGNLTAATFKTYTVGSSSATPSALGSATAGYFTATTTSQLASTTAVTAISQIFFTVSATTTIPGVTCNAGAPATTTVAALYPGNGFKINMSAAPTGTAAPFCYQYRIVN